MHKPRQFSFDVVLIAVFIRRPIADGDSQTVRIGMVHIHGRQMRKLGRLCIYIAIALPQFGVPDPEQEIQHSGHGSAGVAEELEQELSVGGVEPVEVAGFEDWIKGVLLRVPMAVVIAAAPVGLDGRISLQTLWLLGFGRLMFE